MTLGEKMKKARNSCGLSQQQLADKLAVSRSAVAKWETDKGLPDVGNLKTLARLLNVSVDHLLDESEATDKTAIRETYSLAAYGRGCKKVKKDRFIRERFPDAKIYPLLAQRDMTGLQACTPQLPECGKGVETPHQTDKAFYLIEKEKQKLLATVTDTCIEVRSLEQKDCSQFQLDSWHFIKSNYELIE